MLSRRKRSSASVGQDSSRNSNDPIRTDDELIESILQGNAFAFQALMERYKGVLTGYLFGKLPTDIDLNDLMQEIYLSAYRNLSNLRDRRKLASWLVSIARNKLNDALRERQRNVVSPAPRSRGEDAQREILNVPDTAPLPSETAQKTQIQKDVVRSIGRLPEKYRLVLTMRLFEERTLVEIAAALNISESAARVRLHRGLKQLRKRMAK